MKTILRTYSSGMLVQEQINEYSLEEFNILQEKNKIDNIEVFKKIIQEVSLN